VRASQEFAIGMALTLGGMGVLTAVPPSAAYLSDGSRWSYVSVNGAFVSPWPPPDVAGRQLPPGTRFDRVRIYWPFLVAEHGIVLTLGALLIATLARRRRRLRS